MKLLELIKDIEVVSMCGSADAQVTDLAYNTSCIGPGACFVALRGQKSDGHDFIDAAVSKGAGVIVTERAVLELGGVTNVVVENSRKALAEMSARFFGEPSREMKLVGVTGTNGKTTITYLLEAIFRTAGLNPGVIGTVSYRFGNVSESASNTTPESYELQKMLRKMRNAGVGACAMEVSSHSLVQSRVVGCDFDAAVFTNLTPEHLDYHGEMESYFRAKAMLFEEMLANSSKQDPFAVINLNDPYGMELKKKCPVHAITYGLEGKTDVSARAVQFDTCGLNMRIETPSGQFECKSDLCGKFNALNILAASAVADRMGIDPQVTALAIGEVSVVPGRFEPVPNRRGIFALVDYAHTPDALENVLGHARRFVKNGGRLISVFGCGGDRDRNKRPHMGRVAAKISDVVIVTSDNPRTERPEAIIEEILPGVRDVARPFAGGEGYEVICDRRLAISRAAEIARSGDVIVVAGKGHEDYQIIGTKRIEFDDRKILREELAKQ